MGVIIRWGFPDLGNIFKNHRYWVPKLEHRNMFLSLKFYTLSWGTMFFTNYWIHHWIKEGLRSGLAELMSQISRGVPFQLYTRFAY